MLEIAGGIVIGGIALFVLYTLLIALCEWWETR